MQQIAKLIKPILLAARIWILTSLVFGTGWLLYSLFFGRGIEMAFLSIVATICAAVGSLPVLLVFSIVIPRIEPLSVSVNEKISRLVLTCFFCTLLYGLLVGFVFSNSYENNHYWSDYMGYALEVTGVLFASSAIAMLLSGNTILHFFSSQQTHSLTKINFTMDTEQQPYVLHEEKNH